MGFKESTGVKFVIHVAAVVILKEQYAPRHMVLPDQYFDRTSQGQKHTFFGDGIVAHVEFADPTGENLRNMLLEVARAEGLAVHNGGKYVNIDGPGFSTKVESLVYRKFGFDVVGMTNLAEAKLAREAEVALATIAMVTDFDCWHNEMEAVIAERVVSHLPVNAENAQKVIKRAISAISVHANWPEHRALDSAIMTAKYHWPHATVEKLGSIVSRFLKD